MGSIFFNFKKGNRMQIKVEMILDTDLQGKKAVQKFIQELQSKVSINAYDGRPESPVASLTINYLPKS